MTIKLYAATDAKDTDFTTVLIDVQPDGKAMNVTEGIMRVRFRESIWEAPKLLTPGQTYDYTLELLPTAQVFQKGHQIRVHLSSSRWFRYASAPRLCRDKLRHPEHRGYSTQAAMGPEHEHRQ